MNFAELLNLFGGVGLFLYGMTIMSNGLKSAAGDKLRDILEKVTSNRIAAVLIGVLVTMVIQSSSATDMMVIGFVNSGLMTLGQAIEVIMGANIGTTVTAQVTAFNLTAYAPLLLFIGCMMALFFSKPIIKNVGSIILGFGMLFVGVGMIKTAISPLSDSPEFISLLRTLDLPILAILFGVGFTALLQSSSSSVVIFQTFAVQGLLTYRQTVWLVIGAAIGSVAPNLLASLTGGRDGKRTAFLNLIFNIYRAILVSLLITFVPQTLDWIESLSPGDVARQVANTHTIFAVIAVITAVPMADVFVSIARKILPLVPSELRAKEEMRLVFLNDIEKMVPAMAMKQAFLEVKRMGNFARDNLETALSYFENPSDEKKAARIEEVEDVVDYLNHAIQDKLVLLRSRTLSEKDVFRLTKYTQVASNFERISDHAENIMEFADRLKNNKVTMSEAAMRELHTMGSAVMQTMNLSMQIFEEERFDLLSQAGNLEQKVDDMQEQYIQNHIERLMENRCNPLSGVVFTDMCTDLERCSDQAINIATALFPHDRRY